MTQPTTPRPAGHALVEALVAQGVDTAFGVPGESYLAALDGFYEHRGRIRFVSCRNEGGASFMAEAQGKLTGRPGICFVTRGPGASNAAIGLHTAFQDSTPLVLFIGQVASHQRDREAFQEVDYRQMFGPGTLGFAKWVGEVHDPDRLPEYVARAFHTALQGRPGPVVLALPEDMLSATTAAPVLPRVEPALAAPAPEALRDLRERLAAARQPFVIVGGSGWDARACEALERFAERWQLPIGCAFRFQDTFDNRHPNYAGEVGIGINPKLAQRIRDADLVLAVGPRLGEMTTGGYELLAPPRPRQQLIHVHAGAEELGRVYAADLLVHSSMACIGPALAELDAPASLPVGRMDAQRARRLRGQPRAFTGDAARHGRARAEHRSPGARGCRLHQRRRQLQRLAASLPPLRRPAPRRTQPACADLGRHGLRRPGRDRGVAAATRANGGEHRRRRRLPHDRPGAGHCRRPWRRQRPGKLVSVVVDNGSYGTIRMHQEREYPGRVSGSDLGNPDFAALARAYGWFAPDRVDTTAAFEPALHAALGAGRPALIHVRLAADVITSRTTLGAIREKAEARLASAREQVSGPPA
jgi:acetolactate synthase-1/2/3 large subunit